MRTNGYITINGNRVVSTSSPTYRGFTLVQLNVSSCLPTNTLTFDTSGSTNNSDNMATYINSLSLNTVLIGVTADEPTYSLTQNATSALLAIGVNATGLQFRGKVTFMAQIGQPANAVSTVAPSGGDSSKITVNMTGNCHSIWDSLILISIVAHIKLV